MPVRSLPNNEGVFQIGKAASGILSTTRRGDGMQIVQYVTDVESASAGSRAHAARYAAALPCRIAYDSAPGNRAHRSMCSTAADDCYIVFDKTILDHGTCPLAVNATARAVSDSEAIKD
jgi:hypothetical protein